MSPTITAFRQSPDRGRGLARDMRVRRALEEVGQPYDVRLLSFGEMKEQAHRASWMIFRTSPPMSPAAGHGRPTAVPSPLSWRCSPPHRAG